MKLIRIIAMLLALTVAILTVASAYAGSVNPQSWALPSVLAMIFPAMLLLTVILTILNLFICRKAAIVSAASLLCCLSPALDVCPLNFSEPAADGKPLTLLTYNVMQLTDFTGTSVPDSPNPTLRMLASSEADIIALEECYDIASIATGNANRPLLDSISRHYPYRSYGARGQSLLSRFPFDEIILSRPNADDFRVRAFRIYIGNDTITLFDVHLQSIGLTPDDKQLYRDLTRGDTQGRGIKGEIREIRSDLISKLTAAFRSRALQTAALTDMIAETGGKCIVCGDFNDVPGCYALRSLASTGLRDAWRQSALGPAITYHANRLYFRIDHILYSPQLITPLRTRRLTWPYSDHYPVEMTFTLNNPATTQD